MGPSPSRAGDVHLMEVERGSEAREGDQEGSWGHLPSGWGAQLGQCLLPPPRVRLKPWKQLQEDCSVSSKESESRPLPDAAAHAQMRLH